MAVMMSETKVHAMEMAIFYASTSLFMTSLRPSLPSIINISRNASNSPIITPIARLAINLSVFLVSCSFLSYKYAASTPCRS